MIRTSRAIVAVLLFASPAIAHDFWTTGEAVPEWVKHQCCGEKEAHMLDPNSVHVVEGGYTVDRLPGFFLKESETLPSPDGHFWIFIGEPNEYHAKPIVRCFFRPITGV